MSDDEFLLPPAGPLGRSAEEVRRRILEQISSGALQPGQRLGAERDLSKRYRISRSTLRTALDALESAGAVRRSLGRTGGTFIADRRVERDLTAMAGLPTYLRRQGFEAGARVLSTATAEADEETARSLGLVAGAVILEVVRVRLADGDPISLERARFPAERFSGLLDRPLGGSLYSLLQTDYDLVPGEAVERIEIVSAPPSTARFWG
jgi:GntR family transcriptional regulator